MKIKTENASIKQELDGTYIVDFGALEQGTKAEVTLSCKSDNNIKNFWIKKTCGCTVPKVNIINQQEVQATINYKNIHTLGSFSKVLFLNYTENNKVEKIKIKLKGNIKNV